MNADQLQAYVAGHKPVVLGAAAAAVTGLALLQRRKKAGAAAPSSPAARPTSSQPAGTIPAAAVVPSQSYGSTYDSSAYDVYNALSGQLEQLRQTSGTGTTAAPTPVASTLFAPSGSGRFVRYADGGVFEVESDGSLFGLTPNQNEQATRAAGPGLSWEQLQGTMPMKYSTAANLATKNPAA